MKALIAQGQCECQDGAGLEHWVQCEAVHVQRRYAMQFGRSHAVLLAAWANDLDVMRKLVAHGVDPSLTATDGTTPLTVAAEVGHEPGITRSTESSGLAAVKLCLELGANVNAVNQRGDTAPHGAAWREGGESIVQLLVDKGANLNAKNNRGWTPSVIAEGIHTGGNFVHSETTAHAPRKLGAEPSPPDISREPNAPFGTATIQ